MKNIPKKNSVLIIGFHFTHMGKSAGYDKLADYMPFRYINSEKLFFGKSYFGTIKRKFNLFFLECLSFFNTSKYDLVHYLYPENHLLFSIKSKAKYLATFHQPIGWFESVENSKTLMNRLRKISYKKLDGIIVLTSEMVEKIKKIYPHSKVEFIHHGVEPFNNYFLPAKSKQNLNIAIIGTNFRDLKTVLSMVEYSNKKDKKWTLHFIGINRSWEKELRKYEKIIIHPKLTEKEYLNLFSSMHLNILPLNSATANNAMLEAHSLGIPTVVTDLPSTREYGVSTTKYFQNFNELLNHVNTFESMSLSDFNHIKEKTRNDSSFFYWENISQKVTKFYNEILSEK